VDNQFVASYVRAPFSACSTSYRGDDTLLLDPSDPSFASVSAIGAQGPASKSGGL